MMKTLLRTRIRGLTAWANMRLLAYNEQLSNVLVDLLEGTQLKFLIESITSKEIKRLESFDGLTEQQKMTRFEWIVADLKACGILSPADIVDYRQCAVRSAEHVFELLYKMVTFDLLHLWERLEYLMNKDDGVVTQFAFNWTPDPPPVKKKRTIVKKSMLTGFGSAAFTEEEADTTSPDEEWIKYPGAEIMKSYKRRNKRWMEVDPKPSDCVLDIVHILLRTTEEGRKLQCSNLRDLCDSRVLCAIINAFVPNTFTTELLLNDRWTINTALQTGEEMFHLTTKFDSEDLVQSDEMSVCAYFSAYFMLAYKFRQSRAVTQRHTWLQQMVREYSHEMDLLTADDSLEIRQHIQSTLDKYKDDLSKVKKRFDVESCIEWVHHVHLTQAKLHKEIQQKMREKFEVVAAPRTCTVSYLCQSLHLNLSISGSLGFYKTEEKENFNDNRRLVLRHVQSGNFIDDLDNKTRDTMRKLLSLPAYGICEIEPRKYPQYEFFFECPSKNKQLKVGTSFLYQVFPSNFLSWQKMLLKACKDADMDIVGKLVTFFRGNGSFINCREGRTRNTPLHLACRYGHYKVVLFLLENGAHIDALNYFHCSPLFSAIEGLHRKICHLLIEWGCDVHVKNSKGVEPLDTVKNEDFRFYLNDVYKWYQSYVPLIVNGDMSVLNNVIRDHVTGVRPLCSLSSRCINGSTLLHTAAYYGCTTAVKNLLLMRVDTNILDYKHATPLHRTRDPITMKMLLEAGARHNLTDIDGNTALHIKCYGEKQMESEMECIALLLSHGASLYPANNSGLLAIHCAAMQGRTDIIDLMLNQPDTNLTSTLNGDTNKTPPSVVNLAVINDYVEAALWLLENGFTFKKSEPDVLLKRILREQVKITRRTDAIELLLKYGANPQPTYQGGNTALHYAAAMKGGTDMVELLLGYGADVNVANIDGSTPLFIATQNCNQHVSAALINCGANIRHKNYCGLTAFDHIVDFDEWLDTGYFTEEVQARFKGAYRRLLLMRAITRKESTINLLTIQQLKENVRNKIADIQP